MTNDAIYTWNTYRTNDGQPSGVVIKGSPGQVGGVMIGNINGGLNCYVKLYDKASQPTASDTPKVVFTVNLGTQFGFLSEAGIDFTNGIAVRITSNWQDNDNTGAAAGSYQVSVFFR